MKVIQLKLITSMMLTAIGIQNFAQAPSFLPLQFSWGKSAGGIEWDNHFRTATDASGNVYVLGFTYSPVFYAGNDSIDLSANTGSSVYLIKYDPSGNLLWRKIYNANTSDERVDLLLQNNLIHIAAGFSGNLQLEDSVFSSAGGGSAQALVFAGFDLNGNLIYAETLDVGTAEFSSVDLAADSTGRLYFLSAFEGSISTAAGNFSSAGNGADLIWGRLNLNGSPDWIRVLGSNEDDKAGSILIDREGKLLFNGRFTSSLNMGAAVLNSPVGYDWFLAKADPANGNVIWAISEGAPGAEDRISAMAVNPWNEIIISGRFSSSFNMGSSNISTVGNDDIFVAKYSATGNFRWVRTFGTKGENDWTANQLGIDDAGTIWMESSMGGDNDGQNYPVYYGSAGDSLNLSGNQDFVFCRFSNNGDLLAIQAYGTATYEFCQDYAFDPLNGTAIIAGHITADTTIFNLDRLSVRGGFADGFVSKILPNIFARNDQAIVSSVNPQMIMVLNNDIVPTGSTLQIVEAARHGSALVMADNHIAYNATGFFAGNDTLRYRICAGNECEEALLIINNDFPLSTHENGELMGMSIRPNPAVSQLFFTADSDKPYTFQIFNHLGQAEAAAQEAWGSQSIDISPLKAGVYLLKISDTGGRILKTVKWIKLP